MVSNPPALWYTHKEGTHVTSWVELEDFVAPEYPHFKVTITKEVPEHDGYCSDVGWGTAEPKGYVTETLVRAFRNDTWSMEDFKGRSFRFLNGCTNSVGNGGAGSGCCEYLTTITITSIELKT